MPRRAPTPTIVSLLVAIAALVAGFQKCRPTPSPSAMQVGEVKVLFSPRGGCTDAIVGAVGQAQRSVLVQAFSFTSPPIAQAIVDAHRRKLDVKVVLDKSQETERYTEADFLSNQGVPVWIDASHAIAHNKIIIIDEQIVITGSFNFTKSAEERNAENLLILRAAPDVARAYVDNWHKHHRHARPYNRPPGPNRTGDQ